MCHVTIQVFRTYLAGGLIHRGGFRFAINIDPVQFLIYSAQFNSMALNYRLPRFVSLLSALVHTHAHAPHSAPFQADKGGMSVADRNPRLAVIPSGHGIPPFIPSSLSAFF